MYNFVSQGTHSSPSRRNSDNNKVEVCGSLSRENTRFFQRFAVFQHEFANFSLSCVAFRAENSKRTEAVTFEILRFLIYFSIKQPLFCCLNGPIVPYICIVSIRLGWNASWDFMQAFWPWHIMHLEQWATLIYVKHQKGVLPDIVSSFWPWHIMHLVQWATLIYLKQH